MPATDEAVALAVSAADAADDRKATDLTILDVADILALVDVFLIATATSDRQLRAVAEAIEQRLREEGGHRPRRREGEPSSGWLLLDFGDLVCHLFSTEEREFYSLERLWADVPRVDPRTGDRIAPTRAAGRPVEEAGGDDTGLDAVDEA